MLDVARVWSQARATHPALADGRIDWDKALVDTLPDFLAAENDAAFSAALQKLMAPLDDPALRILSQEPVDWAQPPPDKLAFAWLPGNTAWIRFQPGAAFALPAPEILLGAERVVVDVRPVGPAGADRVDWEAALHRLISQLIAQPVTLPAERYRFTSGPRAADPTQWEGLHNGFIMLEAGRIMPSANSRSRPMAFIVNETEPVPKAIVALQQAKLAVVVSEEAAWRSRSGPLQTVWMSNGLRAEFGAGELVSAGGAAGFSANLALPADRGAGPGSAVVAGFYDEALGQMGGLKVGDELLLLDGKNVKDLVAGLLPRVAASTEAARMRNAMYELFQGANGSALTLTVDDGRGPARELTLQRSVMDEAVPMRPAEPIVRKLAPEVGYVDLDRLLPEAVPAMFESMKDVGAIIFDMRGYPHGTARAIAKRLNTGKIGALGASSYQNVVLAHPQHAELQLVYTDRLFPPRAALYRGKVVVLINEHAQSQAEHLALMFEGAAPVTFIGTPSAGANGDIRQVTLPGGVFISYSSLEVRHANGGQLQRLGVQPHIAVAPTIAGLRAGRDEVLERALAFLAGRDAK